VPFVVKAFSDFLIPGIRVNPWYAFAFSDHPITSITRSPDLPLCSFVPFVVKAFSDFLICVDQRSSAVRFFLVFSQLPCN
jgi:hypothetical protein